jgi:hypothetical protein
MTQVEKVKIAERELKENVDIVMVNIHSAPSIPTVTQNEDTNYSNLATVKEHGKLKITEMTEGAATALSEESSDEITCDSKKAACEKVRTNAAVSNDTADEITRVSPQDMLV